MRWKNSLESPNKYIPAPKPIAKAGRVARNRGNALVGSGVPSIFAPSKTAYEERDAR